MVNEQAYNEIHSFTKANLVTLVAVSKLKPVSDIAQMYAHGQRHFGENYVQELVEKQAKLPADIRWHFIGHLQSNKVKYIAPFVYLIQSVDSAKLLKEIDKQAAKNNRTINVLLQVHIAEEETKFGFNEAELKAFEIGLYKNVNIIGLMGMATFTDDKEKVKREFDHLQKIYSTFAAQKNITLTTLSMGMSDDYKLAIYCGSNMVRIGSLLFGRR
jgi:pyridoxal phosphate enzyme (YggS family)